MKSVLLSSLLLLSNMSFAADIAPGKTLYSISHSVVMMNAPSAKDCKNTDGRWDKADQMCFIDSADTLTFDKSEKDLKITITTITTNGHQCEFQSEKAVQTDINTILASAASMKYDEKGNEIPASCEVTVKFNADGSVSSSQNDFEACRQFCGMNASLDIDGATKTSQSNLN